MRSRTWLLACAVALTLSCGKEDGGPAQPLSECSSNVSVFTAGGTLPSFDWTPSCLAGALLVEEFGQERWAIDNGRRNALAPPVQYGLGGGFAVPLRTGHTYDVSVFRWNGTDFVLIGTTWFTP